MTLPPALIPPTSFKCLFYTIKYYILIFNQICVLILGLSYKNNTTGNRPLILSINKNALEKYYFSTCHKFSIHACTII